MTSTDLIVVRHAQSEWNAVGRWQGHADPPLSELGRRQATVAASSVGRVDGIIASDLKRASQTAEIVAGQVGAGGVAVDARLRERDTGEWTGLTRSEIGRRWPGWIEDGRRPHGFEGSVAVLARVTAAFHAIVEQRPGTRLLVVTHGGVIRALAASHGLADAPVAHLAGLVLRWSPAAVTVLEAVALLDGQPAAAAQDDEQRIDVDIAE